MNDVDQIIKNVTDYTPFTEQISTNYTFENEFRFRTRHEEWKKNDQSKNEKE